MRVSLITCAWLSAHVEFENSGYHDHGLRAVAVLEHGKFHRFGAVDEQAAAKAFLIPNDPVASAVPADQEQRGSGATRRGRFVYDTSPLFGLGNGSAHDRKIVVVFRYEAISVVKKVRLELAPDLAHVRGHTPQT